MKTLRIAPVVLLMALAAYLHAQGVTVGGTSNAGGTSNLQGSGQVTISSIAVTPAAQSQNVGQSVGFTATATLSNGTTVDLTTSAAWSTTNSAIASFSSLTATENTLCVSVGTVNIIAALGGATGSTSLTCIGVLPPPPSLASITVTPASPSIAVGQSVAMTATGTYSDNSTQDITATVAWVSGTPAKATVGPLTTTEAVNCVAGGTSIITATSSAISGTSTVTCNAVLTAIIVTPATPTIVAGTGIGFIATGSYNDGSKQDVTTRAVWSSSAPTIASLGALTTQQAVNGLAAGTSTIAAAVGSVAGNTVLTVTTPGPPPPTLSSIALSPASPTVNVASSLGFKATGTYSDNSTQDVTSAATWVSGTPGTATIQAASNPQNVKCIANGTSVITATVGIVSGNTTLTCQTPAPTLSSIAVTPASQTQYNGSTVQFTATGTYSDGSTQNLTSQVTWASGTPAVATIGASVGLATCIANSGSTTITATLGVSGTTSLTCQAATTNTGENTYVTTGGLWIGPTTDGPASMPTSGMNTARSNTPSPGATVTVLTNSFADLQAKITAAVCGTTIIIPAKNGAAQAVYTGQLIIPATACSAGQWITVRTDQIASLPAEGNRVSPAFVGVTSLAGRPAYSQPSIAGIYMPKLIASVNNTIKPTAGMSRWRFEGLEVTSTSGVTVFDLIPLQGTDNIILDQMLIHGGNSPTWQDNHDIARGVYMGSATTNAVINSYIGDIHCTAAGQGCDSNAIYAGGVGSTTDGPHKIYNNFLEAAGMSIFTGGGGVGTSTVPSTDLEIRSNHGFKPLFWKSNDPTYFGTSFIIKNILEFKNTNRALIEGNIFEQVWVGQSDQFGTLVNLGSKNQAIVNFSTGNSDGAGNLTRTSGASFNSNVISPLCSVANHCKVAVNNAVNATQFRAQTFTDANHINVSPAPPSATGASIVTCAPGVSPTAVVSNIIMRFNYLGHASRGTAVFAVQSDCGDFSLGDFNISIHDEVQDDLDGFAWSTSTGACCAWASAYQVQNEFASPNNLHDITISHTTSLPHLTGSSNGFGPSFGFGYQSSTAGLIKNLQMTDNISAGGFQNGSKGVCSGAALSALATLQCFDVLSGVAQNSFCFDHNVLAVTTVTTLGKTNNNPPYPAAGQSPNCPFVTTGNPLPTGYPAIQFTNLNNASNGNYLLLTSSPYHNAGSDGKDVGADISAVNGKTAGVE